MNEHDQAEFMRAVETIDGEDARRMVDSLGGPSLLFDPDSPDGRRCLAAGEYPGYNVVSLVVKRAQRKALRVR